MDDLQIPPTEAEVADLCSLPSVVGIIARQLAFQRDMLIARVEAAELERDVLNGTTCAEEMADGNGPCGICSTCRCARVEASPTLVWTDAKPTVPGWYWYRDDVNDHRESWAMLEYRNDETVYDEGFSHHIGELTGQFAGPIPQPEEPKWMTTKATWKI